MDQDLKPKYEGFGTRVNHRAASVYVFQANFRLFPLILHCDRIMELGIDLSQRAKFDKSDSVVNPEVQGR